MLSKVDDSKNKCISVYINMCVFFLIMVVAKMIKVIKRGDLPTVVNLFPFFFSIFSTYPLLPLINRETT